MASVNIVDRSELLEKMQSLLELDASDTAIVTIDMHRGHLDQEIATMPATPEDSKRVIDAARDALGFAREHAIPVIHVTLAFRKIPGLAARACRRRSGRRSHRS